MRPGGWFPAAAILAAATAACGPASDTQSPWADQLLPLPVGATRDYRVIDAQGRVSARTERVVAEDVIDGDPVVVIESTQDGVVTRSYVRRGDPLILALQKETARAGALGESVRLDPGEPLGLSAGSLHAGLELEASWSIVSGRSTAERVTERWRVEALRDRVSVDAGDFDAVRILRRRDDGTESRMWFARGVGMVRCEGERREVLLGWSLPAR